MNLQSKLLPFIPITHIVLIAALVSILTSVASWYHYQNAFFSTLIIGCIIASLIKPRFAIACLCISFFAWQTHKNMQTKFDNFNANQEFLKTPVNIRATITHKTMSFLQKDQAMLILQSCSISTSYYQKIDNKTILMLMPAKQAQKLQTGQQIFINQIILQQPKPSVDFYKYLLKEGIWATAFVTNQKIKIYDKKISWFCYCYNIFTKSLHLENLQLFDPLFLGKREKNSASIDIQHQSTYWGIAHHMARSGIHLVTLFGLCMGFFHLLRMRYFYRYLVCSILALLYFQITIASISFIRALCMILIQMFAKLHQFNYSSVHALSLTTLFIVVHNPFCVFFLDFQLSFGITAVIIWLFNRKWSKTIVLPKANPLPL